MGDCFTDSEHFPQGGLQYLERIRSLAAKYGLRVIIDLHIDLHVVPGAQLSQNRDIGQFVPTFGCYQLFNTNKLSSSLNGSLLESIPKRLFLL